MIEPGTPCPLCGVRPDVECQHRPAQDAPTTRKKPDPVDGRKSNRGAGHVFGFGI